MVFYHIGRKAMNILHIFFTTLLMKLCEPKVNIFFINIEQENMDSTTGSLNLHRGFETQNTTSADNSQ